MLTALHTFTSPLRHASSFSALPPALADRYIPHADMHTRCPIHSTLWYPHSLSATSTLYRPNSLSSTLKTLLSKLAVHYTQNSDIHTRSMQHSTLYRPHSLSTTLNTLISTLARHYTQQSTVHTRCPLHSTLWYPHSLSTTINNLKSKLARRYV